MKALIRTLVNQKGMSAMELIVASALFVGISVGVLKTMENQGQTDLKNRQNLSIETTVKILNDSLKKKSFCDAMFEGVTAKNLTDYAGVTDSQIKARQKSKSQGNNIGSLSPVKLEKLNLDLGNKMEGKTQLRDLRFNIGKVSGKTTVFMNLEFNSDVKGKVRRTLKQIAIPIKIDSGTGKIECSGFKGSDIHNEGLKKVCEISGGTYSAGICTMDGINNDLAKAIQENMCRILGATGLGGAVCEKINVSNTLNSTNLTTGKVCISGGSECRTKFDNSACSNYLQAVNANGDKSCGGIIFTAGGGSSSSSSSGGGNCSDKDNYSLAGANSATGINTCTYNVFTSDGAGGCAPMNTSTSAGVCQRFRSGTCQGTGASKTAGIVENYPDGTACGAGGEKCQSGTCVAPPPNCDTLDFYKITGGNTATGSNTCDFVDYSLQNGNQCNSSTSVSATAGVCKKIKSGTCTGTTAAVIENYADGTNCGGGNKCNNGRCESAKPGNICDAHLAGEPLFDNQGACEAGDYVCTSMGGFRKMPIEICMLDPSDSTCIEHFCRTRKIVWGTWQGSGSEDSCRTGVPTCKSLVGKKCDTGKGGWMECNDNPLPYGSPGCQINQSVECK